jgi:prepilin peptidase CpaA
VSHLFLAAAVAVTAIAAVIDWKTEEIPNWLTFGALAVAPLAHAAFGFHEAGPVGALWGLGFSLAGIVLCGAVPFLLFYLGGGFGGDVKLLGALGGILAPMLGIEAEMYAFVAAALYAPARMAWEGRLLQTLANSARLVVNPFLPKEKRREVPAELMSTLRFGPAAFVGTLIVVLENWRDA